MKGGRGSLGPRVGRGAGVRARSPSRATSAGRERGVWALEDELGTGRADLGRGKRRLTRLASSVLSPGSPHDIRGRGGGLRLRRQGGFS